MTNHSSLTIKADFVIRECQLQQVNNHIRRTVGDKVTTSGNGKKPVAPSVQQYSAKEKADISKYLQMCFGFQVYCTTYATIGNEAAFMVQHAHIILTPSCKFKK